LAGANTLAYFGEGEKMFYNIGPSPELLVIHYEDFLTDPSKELLSVLKFLQFPVNITKIFFAIILSFRQGPNALKMQSYKHSSLF
jgi:hypothetical protein